MRISDWSSDVCSSDLVCAGPSLEAKMIKETRESRVARRDAFTAERDDHEAGNNSDGGINATAWGVRHEASDLGGICVLSGNGRSEEHTSELQSLMRISYAVFCLKKKTQHAETHNPYTTK